MTLAAFPLVIFLAALAFAYAVRKPPEGVCACGAPRYAGPRCYAHRASPYRRFRWWVIGRLEGRPRALKAWLRWTPYGYIRNQCGFHGCNNVQRWTWRGGTGWCSVKHIGDWKKGLKVSRGRADVQIMNPETRILLHGAGFWIVLLALFLTAWAGASLMKRIGWMR